MDNALKAVSMTDDEYRVANYIVLFGDENKRDLEGVLGGRKNVDGTAGEWFTKDTQLESRHTAMGKLPLDWEHDLQHEDVDVGLLGYVDWTTKAIDDIGIFVERVLYRSNKYTQAIKELIDEGIVSTSSEGDITKFQIAKNGYIETWPLIGDTLTVAPMEPRMLSENALQAYKALGFAELEPEAAPEGGNAGDAVKASDVVLEDNTITNGGIEMSANENTQPLTLDAIKELFTPYAEEVKALRQEIEENKPAIKTAKVQVVQDEMDRKAEDPDVPAYKSVGNFLFDVKAAESPGGITVQLLKSQKAISGASSVVPADGGYLIGTDHTNEILLPIYTSRIMDKVKKFRITTNSNSVEVPGIDETSRATGSRWGGVRAYYVDEGDEITSSKVKVKKIRMNLARVAVLAYGTGDVLADAGLMGTFIVEAAQQELQFFMENGIINGTGAGQPQGVKECAGRVLNAKDGGQAADTILAENIISMWSRRDSRGSYVWLSHQAVTAALPFMTIDVGTGGVPVYMPPGGLSNLPYATLYGQQVIEMEQIPTLGDEGDLELVDLGQYYWAEKGGIQQAASMHVRFIYDEMAFRFMTRYDGQPAWASPLTPFAGGSTTPPTISPYVILAERA